MRERNIPITVENVIGEMDTILQAREIMERLYVVHAHQIARGGNQVFLDVASPVELEILNSLGKTTFHSIASGVRTVDKFLPIYGEDDVERIAQTMFGPRKRGGTNPRAGVLGGGYFQAGPHSVYGMERRVDPSEQDHDKGQPVYSPYTEAHEFLRRTRLRKFIVSPY